jgi:hypothetical protein
MLKIFESGGRNHPLANGFSLNFLNYDKIKNPHKPGMVVHMFKPSTRQAEAGDL